MARYFYILLFCLLSISVKALDVSVIISQYYSVQPDLQPYIEVYFHNVASSLSRIKEAQNDSLFDSKDMDFNPVNTTSISPLSIWVTLLMYIKVLQKLM